MTSARDEILARLGRTLDRDGRDRAAARAAIEAYIAQPAPGPRPHVPEDLVARMRQRSEALASSWDSVTALKAAPAAVASYLDACAVGREGLVAWPALRSLPWAAAGLSPAFRAARGEDRAGLTGCFCAIAETGTLMLCSGPDTPSGVSLLPATHVALLPRSRLVATMEDAWALWRQERGALPRGVNFISGPSRTADIEQTVVLGAHGPSRVHLILVNEA